MRLTTIMFLSAILLSGCGVKEYHESQPEIAEQRTAETKAIGKALVNMTKAIMGPQQIVMPVVPPPVSPQKKAVPAKNQKKPEVCSDCGGTDLNNELTFVLEPDGEWVEESLAGTDREFQPVEVDGICQDCEAQNTGEVVHELQQPPGHDPAGLLLQYILIQQQAQSRAALAAERTKQVQALTALAAAAFGRAQHQQAAPFDPTALGSEIVKQTPLGLAIWGLHALGKSKGNSSTTATLANGSSLGQGGNSGAGYSAPITTTKTTTISGAE